MSVSNAKFTVHIVFRLTKVSNIGFFLSVSILLFNLLFLLKTNMPILCMNLIQKAHFFNGKQAYFEVWHCSFKAVIQDMKCNRQTPSIHYTTTAA